MNTRNCKICGDKFVPNGSRQIYCKKVIIKECPVCHKKFKSFCSAEAPEYCSSKCAGQGSMFKEYTCANCGEKFHPKSSRQKYCKKPIHKVCPVCGEDFIYLCGDRVPGTCSKTECINKYASIQSQNSLNRPSRKCEWCGEEFHPVNNTQKYCSGPHFQTCVICGKKFEIFIRNTADIPRTCSPECRIKLNFIDGNPFQRSECKESAKQTNLSIYGVDHPMKSTEIKNRMWNSYKEKTGYDHPSHNPEVRSKTAKSTRKSSMFENRVAALLSQYNITYMKHYMMNSDSASHEFDFYLPDYKILIDCDGKYYHAYLDDPDGRHVYDYYDEDRISLIPKDHIFHVIVEGQEEKDIKSLSKIIESINSNTFDYEGDLFRWCRSIEFPYPEYDEKRMLKDYSKLCSLVVDKYCPTSRKGDSIIQQFHRSIYDCHVGNYVSPVEAWYDDELLKKVILNRLIYKNNVDPSKILRGFNISKICPRVSIFNPVLAKYLVMKYLNDFDVVFDPFSGFSGRLLGVSACNKQYVGQDLNQTAVSEANETIKFLNLSQALVKCKDVLESSGEYPCLLTCPPYGTKEHYANETVFKSCDEWIDEILDRFQCSKYVFVVDNTSKYSKFVTEEIRSTSHFVKLKEKVVVISR